MKRRELAKSLVGKFVRLANLPRNLRPTPIRVEEALANGMIRLQGRSGQWAPHLFVVVSSALPKEKSF